MPIARRLARRLAGGAAPTLRDLAIPQALDILLRQLDRHACPDHWSAISDTG